LKQIKDIRNYEGKKPQPIELMVPEAVVRSGKPTAESAKPNFLWDNTGYVLGIDNKGKAANSSITFNSFKEFHHRIGSKSNDAGMRAVLSFLDTWTSEKVTAISNWQDVLDANANIVFRLEGDTQFVHQRKAVQELWESYKSGSASEIFSTCLISGEWQPIARLHSKIKGVQNASQWAHSIVSFNWIRFVP
jgi:CRISPR-associated protein Csd1